MTDKTHWRKQSNRKNQTSSTCSAIRVAAKTVTGDEAPAQEVIIDRLETMNP